MKRLLTKTVVLASLVLGLMLVVFLLPIPYNHDLSAILNKRDLLKDGPGGRIIFVGGSGLYSALDSPLIEERLGRPVRNVGLWAGFGITPVLREIKPYLRASDVVIVIPEYGLTYDKYLDVSRKWIFALAPARNLAPLYGNLPAGMKAFALDFIGLVRSKFEALPFALRQAVKSRSIRIFTTAGYVQYRTFFNGNGDSFRIFPAASSPELIRQRGEDYFSLGEYRGQSLAALNDFCRDEAGQGVRTALMFPAYPEEEYRRFRSGLLQYEQRLRDELLCPIIGNPEDFLYPYGLFTDTIHHLGIEGRRMRTERLIALLQAQPWMRQTASSR